MEKVTTAIIRQKLQLCRKDKEAFKKRFLNNVICQFVICDADR